MSALLLGLVTLPVLQAQVFNTVYNFTGGSDGNWATTGVVQDSAGNLYGATNYGGNVNANCEYGCGVVFKLNGAGTETVLHSFTGYPSDGASPAPVVRDKAGDIYGTATAGGASNEGVVFKIDIAGKETVLYSFTGDYDGCGPAQGLVMDQAGNLYGTTNGCGPSNHGTIFKVDSAGKFTLLHRFVGSEGGAPSLGHLTMDRSGNLYGVNSQGGRRGFCRDYGCGVLYKLTKNGKLTVLHNFSGGTTDGCNPYGSVVQDKGGNLYGITNQCGSNACHSNGCGTIWRVSKKGKESILHHFAEGTSDGCNPYAGVSRDSKGNLYGVTSGCGASGFGALYELSAKGKLSLLHSFDVSSGIIPRGEVLRTPRGTLFGTAYEGGTYNSGTVWSYVP